MTSVELPGPPCVEIQTMSNVFSPPMTPRIVSVNVVPFKFGNTTLQSVRQKPAPSILAASNTSRSMASIAM